MELDQRKLRILRAIIDEYVLSGLPVGSKSISQHRDFIWSPATIRNEMADLEELGYLAQPHTSAGRIPSDKAYRLYVDRMMQRAALTKDELGVIHNYCGERISGVESVMKETAKALSELTNYTAVVLMPDVTMNRLRHLQLVPLAEGRALLVVVTDAGYARDAVIRVPADLTPDELESLSRSLTAQLYNCRMSNVSERLSEEFGKELNKRRDFFEDLMNTIRQGMDAGSGMVELSGATNMLRYAEYSDLNKAMVFLNAVEGKDLLYHMLKKASRMEFTVTIGKENDADALQDCSVVTASYRVGDTPIGTFGVIGPTRMRYGKVASILDGMRLALNDVLKNVIEEDDKDGV